MRNLVIIGVALLIATLATVTSLAEMDELVCSGLSDSDCELLKELAEITERSSGRLTSDLALGFTTPTSDIEVAIALAGKFNYSGDIQSLFDQMEANMDFLDPDESDGEMTLEVEDFDALVEFGKEVFRGFKGELEFTIAIEGDVTELSDLSDLVDINLDDPLTLSLWFVDGEGYIDFTPIGMLLEAPELEGVIGVDFIEVIDFLIADLSEADKEDLLEQIAEGAEPFDSDLVDNEELSDETVAFLSTLLNSERLDNEIVDGIEMVVFQTSLNLLEALASDEAAAVIEEILDELDELGDEAPFFATQFELARILLEEV